MQNLQRIFNTLKRNDSMSHQIFRKTFLPTNTPTMLSKKLFDIYAVVHSSKELNFDDFAELYYIIKTQQSEVPGQRNLRAILCFYFFKQHGILDQKQALGSKGDMQDSFLASIFVQVEAQYFNLSEIEIDKFLFENKIQKNKQVTLGKSLNYVTLSSCQQRHSFKSMSETRPTHFSSGSTIQLKNTQETSMAKSTQKSKKCNCQSGLIQQAVLRSSSKIILMPKLTKTHRRTPSLLLIL